MSGSRTEPVPRRHCGNRFQVSGIRCQVWHCSEPALWESVPGVRYQVSDGTVPNRHRREPFQVSVVPTGTWERDVSDICGGGCVRLKLNKSVFPQAVFRDMLPFLITVSVNCDWKGGRSLPLHSQDPLPSESLHFRVNPTPRKEYPDRRS